MKIKLFTDFRTVVGLILILSFMSSCAAPAPTPTQPAAPAETPTPVVMDTPVPVPTFTAQPTEPPTLPTVTLTPIVTDTPVPAPTVTAQPPVPSAPPTVTPTPPSAADLKTLVEAGLPPTPTPDASGFSPASISEVSVLPLAVDEGSRPLWAVSSLGGRYFEAGQSHFVAIYTYDDAGWQELARLELAGSSDPESLDLSADYLFEGSLTQGFVGSNRIWLQVEGGTGAHSGTYHLLSFDGETLQVEVANFSPSPGAASLADLNGDGAQEVVLNATDPYVFCYACGVRKVAFQVFAWDSVNERMLELSIQPMLMGQQGHPARKPTNRAVELAEAGLWKDALTKITEAKEVAAEVSEPTDSWTLDWDYVLIKLHAEAMAQEVAESPYPLLSNVFYGDYAAALDVMRACEAGECFGPDSPLVAGTVAEGWEETLNDWIAGSTTLALRAQPDLAAAYFLRGWAAYLVDPDSDEALADLARAAELDPDESLFVQVDLPGPTVESLSEFEAELLASGYTAETREFSQDEVTYRAVIYTHEEWYANPNYLLIARLQGKETEIVYTLQNERRIKFVTYGAQGEKALDWVDMNADGLMELPFHEDQGGNCWTCAQLRVLQLRAGGDVVDLTAAVPPEDELGESFVILDLIDADADGVQEWLVLDARFEFAFDLCHACSPAAFRLYAWDGEVYRNASAQFPDYYQPQIDNLTARVQEMAQSDDPWTGDELGSIVSLLLAYENAGRREEGLAVFEQYTDPALYAGRASEEQLASLQEAREFFFSPAD